LVGLAQGGDFLHLRNAAAHADIGLRDVDRLAWSPARYIADRAPPFARRDGDGKSAPDLSARVHILGQRGFLKKNGA
jgi:hypothetical protein